MSRTCRLGSCRLEYASLGAYWPDFVIEEGLSQDFVRNGMCFVLDLATMERFSLRSCCTGGNSDLHVNSETL